LIPRYIADADKKENDIKYGKRERTTTTKIIGECKFGKNVSGKYDFLSCFDCSGIDFQECFFVVQRLLEILIQTGAPQGANNSAVASA
jgi:hypothetical protein